MKIFAAMLVVVALLGFGVLGYFYSNLPSIDMLRNYQPYLATEVFSREYIKIGEFFQERRIFTPLEEIPPMIAKAFISAEDADFYSHRGISPIAIARAMVKNAIAGYKKQGGSTITQQVARSVLLTRKKSYTRKIREVLLALKMERELSKDEILEIYLNHVYLGHSAYGVQAAAKVYYNKNLKELSIAELAVLAGLTKAPSRDNPYSSLEKAKGRQAYVLSRLQAEGHISEGEKKEALLQPLIIQSESDINLSVAPYFVESIRRYAMDKYGSQKILGEGLQIITTLKYDAALAANHSLKQGVIELDQRQGYRGPLEQIQEDQVEQRLEQIKANQESFVLSTDQNYQALVTQVDDQKGISYIDLGFVQGSIEIESMQWARKPNSDVFWENNKITKASQALKKNDVILVRWRDENNGTQRFLLHQEPLAQGALIAMDPHTGAIAAMKGGYDFRSSQFNRIMQSERQPGSSFKPFIYSSALDHNYTPASIIVDAPLVYDDPTTELRWKPKNYGGKFYGDTIFRDCLIKSRNVPTIKIVQDLGIDTVIEYASRFGFTSSLDRNFSLALGSSALKPIELVSAYAVFANGGTLPQYHMIKKIMDKDGQILERHSFDDPALSIEEQLQIRKQALLEKQKHRDAIVQGLQEENNIAENYVISPQTAYMMTHLLKEVITSGTGRRALKLGRPAAGKTGTTNDNFDAWFVGYTPQLVTLVWLGYDQAKDLGVLEGGGRTAVPVWSEFMLKTLKDEPKIDFDIPQGLVFAQIDSQTGKLANEKSKETLFEIFREGSQPTGYSDQAIGSSQSQDFFLDE
ncbi:MAG: PBP1A family penicillin-binding protein [Bdellovibrionales bacterium]|nr:PBP1A family penicillin-binding protein [Bdellovibrionales bacterium]